MKGLLNIMEKERMRRFEIRRSRKWTDDMGEVSGMGGTYEQACRWGVMRGADFMLDNFEQFDPDVALTADGTWASAAYDLLSTEISESISGLSGAMHGAIMGHCRFICREGWDTYCKAMRGRKLE